jgi:hypothetical protein
MDKLRTLLTSIPDALVVKAISSGVSYKRSGLQSLVVKRINGLLQEVDVADRDRLVRSSRGPQTSTGLSRPIGGGARPCRHRPSLRKKKSQKLLPSPRRLCCRGTCACLTNNRLRQNQCACGFATPVAPANGFLKRRGLACIPVGRLSKPNASHLYLDFELDLVFTCGSHQHLRYTTSAYLRPVNHSCWSRQLALHLRRRHRKASEPDR